MRLVQQLQRLCLQAMNDVLLAPQERMTNQQQAEEQSAGGSGGWPQQCSFGVQAGVMHDCTRAPKFLKVAVTWWQLMDKIV